MTSRSSLVTFMVVVLVAVGVARCGETGISAVRVASGLSGPLVVTYAPGDFERVFIVEQTGQVRILKAGVLLETPFVDIGSIVSCCGERGLLGMTFHPDYAANGEFFVNYTDGVGDSVVARYTVSADPNVANPDGMIVLRAEQPHQSHNGAWLEFGPDGFLYVAMGDGGLQQDPANRAQDTGELLGKLLRIDVNGDGFPGDPERNYAVPPNNPFVGSEGLDEIWAFGLRNPWRCAFDRATGDLYISDVGQDLREEISFQPAGFEGGGNYGWRCMEGTSCTGLGGCECTDPSLIPPIHEYAHASGRCAVVGGRVYRGCAITELNGHYFFSDWCSAQVWSFRVLANQVTDLTERTSELVPDEGRLHKIASFGEDAFGELYLSNFVDGDVFKIVAKVVGADCNTNGQADGCDIISGISSDGDGNGVPDECQGDGDGDGDGDVDLFDYAGFLECQTGPDGGEPPQTCSPFDLDGDGDVDAADWGLFQLAFDAC